MAQVSFTHRAPALCKISDTNTTTNENTNTDEKWAKKRIVNVGANTKVLPIPHALAVIGFFSTHD